MRINKIFVMLFASIPSRIAFPGILRQLGHFIGRKDHCCGIVKTLLILYHFKTMNRLVFKDRFQNQRRGDAEAADRAGSRLALSFTPRLFCYSKKAYARFLW
jgi:hypothetical protein